MWLIYALYPEVNDPSTMRKDEILLAQGIVRIRNMQVGHARTLEEARKIALGLTLHTIRDTKGKSLVVGYGVRNYYAPRKVGIQHQVTVTQVRRILRKKMEQGQNIPQEMFA